MRSTMKSVLEVNKPVQTGSEIKAAEKTDQKFSQKHGSLGETDQPPKKKSRKKWSTDIIRRCLYIFRIQVMLGWEKLWIIKTNAITPWLTHATVIEKGGDIASTHPDCSPLILLLSNKRGIIGISILMNAHINYIIKLILKECTWNVYT